MIDPGTGEITLDRVIRIQPTRTSDVIFARVELTIDLDQLFRSVCVKAVHNPSGRAAYVHGAVRAAVKEKRTA
jgi:hypothetical protein